MEDFIIILFIVFILLFSIVRIRRMGNIISKLFLGSFVGYWCISLFISLFNPFGLYKVSIESYLILLLNVVSFILGFLFVKGNSLKIDPVIWCNFQKNIPTIVKSKMLFALLLLATFFSVKIYIDYAALFELQGKRTDSMTEVITSAGSLTTLVYSFFLSPFFYVILPIFVLSLFFYRNWYRIFPMLIFILSYSMIGGRRVTFFTIILAFFFIYMLRDILIGKLIIVSKKIYVLMIFLSITMYVFMCFVTATITGSYSEWNLEAFLYGMNQINETFITYSILPFRLFDYAIHNHYYDMIGETYGWATFGIVHKFFLDLFSLFGINLPPIRDTVVGYLQDTVLFTGVDRVSNYSYTNALYFYLDFKTLGVAVFSFLFGAFIHYTIKIAVKRPSMYSICLLFYLYFVVLHTVFTWHFNKYYSIPLVVFLIYMSIRKNISRL